jgi:membrane protease YdiL (CAAX protease family)
VSPADLRLLLGATALQGALAAVLFARGSVTFASAPLAGVLGALAGMAIGYALYRLLSARDATPPRPASAGAIALLALLYAAIALAEETIWRGWAFDALANSRGALVALIATTLGFALVHGIPQGYAGARFHLVTALAFGVTLLATRSLAGAAAAHVTYNLAVLFGTAVMRKKARHDRLAVG